VSGSGSAVFEESRVLNVEEGEPCASSGARRDRRPRDLATHAPLNLLLAKIAHRSYVISGRIAHAGEGCSGIPRAVSTSAPRGDASRIVVAERITDRPAGEPEAAFERLGGTRQLGLCGVRHR
jgi:hypothetical protein